MQWNVLADGLAQSGHFSHAQSECLEWEHRWPLIKEEILRHKPDIVCMQEVNHYYTCYQPFMHAAGYVGIYKPKALSGVMEAQGTPADGSVIFYRSNMFEVVDEPYVEAFRAPSGTRHNQSLVAVRLRSRDTAHELTAVCLHLKAGKGSDNCAMRVAQTAQLRAYLRSARATGAHVVVCGDFNDVPDSPCMQFAAREPWLGQALAEYGALRQRHGAGPGAAGDAPPFTTWKYRSPEGAAGPQEKQAAIDYVMYSRAGLALLDMVAMPGEGVIGRGALPCAAYPSDHLAVVCRFQLQ